MAEPAPQPRRGARLVVVASSLLAALLLGELFVRVQYAWNDESPPHWDRSIKHEWRWALRHLEAGKPRMRGPAVYEPDLGWLVQPHLDLPGIRTNSIGMRATHDVPLARDPGRRRLLLVGDSYTFGSFATDDESYHTLLGDYLPAWEILNLGVPGYGPDQALLLFEKLGLAYQPDVAVFGFFDRGFFRIKHRFRGYAKPWFELNGADQLLLRGSPVISPEELYQSYASGERRVGRFWHSYLAGSLLSNLTGKFERSSVYRDDPEWALMAAILRRFQRGALAAGIQPFLLIFVNEAEDCDHCVYRQLSELAALEARELGMPVLSLRAPFLAHQGEPLKRPADAGGHLSAAGHALVARLLYEALVDTGLAEGSAQKQSSVLRWKSPDGRKRPPSSTSSGG